MPEYKDGFPTEQGWYDVTVDGMDDRLQHFICRMEGREYWKDIKGNPVEGVILWTGEASALP